MAGEVLRRRAEYDAVVTWGEKLTFALLAHQRFARASKPHVAMMYQFEKPNVSVPLAVAEAQAAVGGHVELRAAHAC